MMSPQGHISVQEVIWRHQLTQWYLMVGHYHTHRCAHIMSHCIHIIRCAPLHQFKAAAMTASFSTGLKEHVEYTNLPPGLSSSNPRSKILSWILDGETVLVLHLLGQEEGGTHLWSPRLLPGDHDFHMVTFFLRVPSPLSEYSEEECGQWLHYPKEQGAVTYLHGTSQSMRSYIRGTRSPFS